MSYWLLFYLLVSVCAKISDTEECGRKCVGEGYMCINGQCYCADGFLPNAFQTSCVKCPGLGETCYGPCCNEHGNGTLHCWYGVCRICQDSIGDWICRYVAVVLLPGLQWTSLFIALLVVATVNPGYTGCKDPLDHILLITTTQAVMGTALILGIVATFILLLKLCSTTNLRPIGNRSNYDSSRLSIGSLQLYVDERLRDAPPRYSRPPPSEAPYPAAVYLNDGFIHDCSVPPPPYSADDKDEENQNNTNPTLHI